MIRVVCFCYLKSHGPWVYFPNTNRPVDFWRPKPAMPQSSRTENEDCPTRSMHVSAATLFFPMIYFTPWYLPRNLKKHISPPTCFFWKYGAPPKSHGWKSHFPKKKNQPGPRGPRACGVCKPSSLASFNAISKRWVFRDKVDMSSSWQMVPGWETAGAGNSLSQGFHDGWILGMRLLAMT